MCQLLLSTQSFQAWMNCWGTIAHVSVLLFFFLSGYVIFYSLDKRFINSTNTYQNLKKYTISRIFRIYPPLIGMLILIICFKIFIKYNYKNLPDEFTYSYKDIINYFFMIKVSLGKINAPLWTLIIEWWFYYIGFTMFLLIRHKNKIIKLLGILSLLVFMRLILSYLNGEIIIYFSIWMFGALSYLFNVFKFKKLMLFISIVFFIYLFIYKNILYQDITKSPLIQFSVIISLIGFIFLTKRINFLTIISGFSYSIYIIHYPIFIFLKTIAFNTGIKNWFTFSLIFMIVITFSYFFAKFFENKNNFIFIEQKIRKLI